MRLRSEQYYRWAFNNGYIRTFKRVSITVRVTPLLFPALTSSNTWSTASPRLSSSTGSCWWSRAFLQVEPLKICMEILRSLPAVAALVHGYGVLLRFTQIYNKHIMHKVWYSHWLKRTAVRHQHRLKLILCLQRTAPRSRLYNQIIIIKKSVVQEENLEEYQT